MKMMGRVPFFLGVVCDLVVLYSHPWLIQAFFKPIQAKNIA